MLPLGDTPESRTIPVVNWLLIIANVLVFLFEISMPESQLNVLIESHGFVPAHFAEHIDTQQLATVFSSMFMHGGWSHLIFNMWFLFIFGDNVEDRLGHIGYLIFYLVCGVLSDLAHLTFGGMSSTPTIGASGAISGVLGAYMIMYPKARVKALLRYSVVEVPATIYLLFWFGLQLFSGLFSMGSVTNQNTGGVAFWAHIGGFAAGTIFALLFARPRNTPELVDRLRDDDRWYG
jgi:membrane associated rhomboid family serine protease